MNDTGIFKYIWRLNALVILLVGVAMVLLLFIEFSARYNDKVDTRVRRRERQEMQLDDSLRLALAFRVSGTSNFVFALSPGGQVRGRRWMPSEIVYNFLFIDGETNRRRWLFEEGGPLVQMWDQLEVEQGPDAEPVIRGIVYHTIETDTNGDGKLTPGDGGSLMISDSDGSNLHVLLEGPITKPEFHVVGQRLFCTYETKDGLNSAVFEMDGTRECLDKAVLLTEP